MLSTPANLVPLVNGVPIGRMEHSSSCFAGKSFWLVRHCFGVNPTHGGWCVNRKAGMAGMVA